MPGRGAPTFLKRQKEQKRAERAQAKRDAKRARRESRAAQARGETIDEAAAEPTEREPGPDDNLDR